MAKEKQTKTVPDTTIPININELLGKVFGEGSKKIAEISKDIKALTLDEQIALAAHLGRRIVQFQDLLAIAAEQITQHPEEDFADPNPLISVVDSSTGAVIGGMYVSTTEKVTRNTSNANVRSKVIDALREAGLIDKYTKTSIELQNDALYAAKSGGELPQHISEMISETKKSTRSATFQAIAAEASGK